MNLGRIIDALSGVIYRSSPKHAPDLILRRLGVATPKRRIEFYTLDRLLRSMGPLEGSILECGTYKGATLLGIAHIMNERGTKARIYGLDSFVGFPAPTAEDAQADGTFHPLIHRGALGDASYEDLQSRIRRLGLQENVQLIKGFFHETLPLLRDETFALVHIDCDLYQPYMTCLEFVYPRMVPGGFVVFDDYGSPVYQGADKAVDEFLSDKPERLEYFAEADGRRYFIRKA